VKILVVDDDKISRSVLSRALAKAGHQTVEADSARAAIGLLHGGEPLSMVITDIMMPDMSGLDLLAYIRSTPSLERMPVLICTVLDNPQTRELAATFDAVGVLPKPIDVTAVRQKLEGVTVTGGPSLLDLDGTMQRLEMGAEACFKLIDELTERLPSVLREIRQRAAEQNRSALQSSISSLLGAAKTIGAERLAAVLQRQLEASEKGDFDLLDSLVIQARREATALQTAMARLREERGPARAAKTPAAAPSAPMPGPEARGEDTVGAVGDEGSKP